MSRFSWWAVLVIILALAADLAVVADVGQPGRGILVFAFLLLGPGLPFARLLRVRWPAGELMLGVALSIALDTAVSETMVLAKVWSAGTALTILIFVAVAGAFLDLFFTLRRKGRVAVG